MNTLTKAQRDYAVKQATSIISKQYVTESLPELTFDEVCNKLKIKDVKGSYRSSYVVEFALENMPQFAKERKEVEAIRGRNKAVKEAKEAAIERATTRIMLGDALEVMDYLESLSDA